MAGKAHRPYEFGVKVSIATTNHRCKGSQSVLHAKALPGNPYDGHTLAAVIEETETLTGRTTERVYVDKGYCGHNAPKPLRVFRSGEKRGVFGTIKPELRRRLQLPLGPQVAEASFAPNPRRGSKLRRNRVNS